MDAMCVICANCGAVAFHYLAEPKSGETIKVEDAEFDDGSHPVAGTTIRCQHCRAALQPLSDGTSVAIPE